MAPLYMLAEHGESMKKAANIGGLRLLGLAIALRDQGASPGRESGPRNHT